MTTCSLSTRNLLLTSFLAVSLVCSANAADKNKAWTDSAVAAAEDPDFLIQGEYGSLEQGAAYAAQVVALGDGKFDAYFLEGGLPGLGWTREKSRTHVGGELIDGKVEFKGKELHAVLANGRITGSFGPVTLDLPKVERKSPTLGMAPPEGAIVLFDGTSAEGWKKGKIVDGLLAATGTTSEKTFADCTIHLEFLTPYKPHARGQGRGNSGVYYGGRWETQVLDSFGLEGKMNETGGIYSIAAPSLNMCFPPLTWQTYDVDLTWAKFDENGERKSWPRITVKLNGVVVHEDQELNKTHTTAAPVKGEFDEKGGPIFLQNHGNPVFYRNIWVLPR
ncbi:MAG: DUF1080 domain-containing protein [Verrucomicrobiales bacterium]|nr:DUF1080 domain-containing protein [Verrucomicrobiales bacterium]